MKFINIYVGWLGCVYDVCVLRNFILYIEVEVGNFVFVDYYIFVDSVYFFRNWLIILLKKLGNFILCKFVLIKEC